jgi:hypothetical protein
VGAELADGPVGDDGDAVAAKDGAEAVGDEDDGAAGQDPFHGGDQRLLGDRVDLGGHLVQDHDRGRGQRGAGQGQDLLLAQ